MFQYCGNNPVNRADPTGKSFILACIIGGAIIGALAGGHIAGSTAKNSSNPNVSSNWGWYAAGGIVGGGIVGGLAGWGVGALATSAAGAAAISSIGTAATAVGNKISQGAQKVVNTVGRVASKITGGGSKPIKNDIINLERTGSALKLDAHHSFSNIVDNYAGFAIKTPISNGTLYQLSGGLNGVQGRFEWIVQSGQVKHTACL